MFLPHPDRQSAGSRFPAVKLCIAVAFGVVIGIMLLETAPDTIAGTQHGAPSMLFIVCIYGFCCTVVGIFCLVRRVGGASQAYRYGILQNIAYWNSGICIGCLLALQAYQPFPRLSRPELTGFIEFSAVLHGEVREIIRRDSTPRAQILRCIVRGELDAEALPPIQSTDVLLTIIIPQPALHTPQQQNSALAATEETIRVAAKHIRLGSRIYADARIRLPAASTHRLPSDIDEELYARSLGVSWYASAMQRNIAILATPSGIRYQLANYAERAQDWLTKRITLLFSEWSAPLALALLSGKSRYLQAETRQQYAQTGTAHILAVSGVHIAVLASLVLVPLGMVRHRWLRYGLFIVVLSFFIPLTGFSPSALRAGTMAALYTLLLTLERRAELLNMLAFTVVLLLLFIPNLLFSAGFQMSVAALLGIALLFPRVQHFCEALVSGKPSVMRLMQENIFLRYSVRAFALSLSASFAVAPVSAWYFGTFAFIAPLANLIIVPLGSIALLYTCASVLTSLLWWNGAALFARTADMCFVAMNSLTSMLTESSVGIIEGRQAFLMACSCLLLLWYALGSASLKQAVLRSGICVCVIISSMMLQRFAGTPSGKMPLTSLSSGATLYARNDVVAALLHAVYPASAGKQQDNMSHTHSILLLQDRRLLGSPADYARRDASFEKYSVEHLLSAADTITLLVTGQASMLYASRIAALLVARSTSQQRQMERPALPVLRIAATGLHYKGRSWFQALDSIYALKIPLINLHSVWKRDSAITLLQTNDSVRVLWNAWKAELCVVQGGKLQKTVVLPQVVHSAAIVRNDNMSR